MAEPIDINKRYQELVLEHSTAELETVLELAREVRQEVDNRLEALVWIVPAALTEPERIEHEARIRTLILMWLKCQPALPKGARASDDSLKKFLFPEPKKGV